MAVNERFRNADQLSLPVASGVVSGQPVLVGSLPGVALTKRGEGGNATTDATVALKGAYDVTVTGAIAAVGTPVYFPAGGGTLTGTATSNTLWGYALATKGSGDGVIPVRIAQV